MLRFRSNTIDRMIFHMIYYGNEYRLPESFNSDDIILDVGAHAGYFAHRVLEKGAGKVVGVEADNENYKLACQNLSTYMDTGRAELILAAAWRSDKNDDVLYHSGYTRFPNHDLLNTGGGDVLWNDQGESLPKVAFDDLLLTLTNHGEQNIRLLKLDCEGAEWPILLTSEHLHLIDEICGEYHEIGGEYDDLEAPFHWQGHQCFTEELLLQLLAMKGFSVSTKRHCHPVTGAKQRLGMFFAKNSRI